jgi:hypothetical protein
LYVAVNSSGLIIADEFIISFQGELIFHRRQTVLAKESQGYSLGSDHKKWNAQEECHLTGSKRGVMGLVILGSIDGGYYSCAFCW